MCSHQSIESSGGDSNAHTPPASTHGEGASPWPLPTGFACPTVRTSSIYGEFSPVLRMIKILFLLQNRLCKRRKVVERKKGGVVYFVVVETLKSPV